MNDSNMKNPSGRLEEFSSQGIANLVWSFARQAQLSGEQPLTQGNNDTEGNNISPISNGRLAVYKKMCGDVGEDLVHRLFTGVAETIVSNENSYLSTPQDMSNTVWSFGCLGLLHKNLFDAISERLYLKFAQENDNDETSQSGNVRSTFKAQEVANFLCAFATLNYTLRSDIMNTFEEYIIRMCSYSKTDENSEYDEKSISKIFSRHELSSIAWACAVLEQYPSKLMPLLYTGLIGSGGTTEENLSRLATLYDDGGLQKKNIMCLLYCQMALDLEAPHLQIHLPGNLLDYWIREQGDPNMFADGNGGENGLILLSTSKLQNDVSRVCQKIGFEHVEEHIVDYDVLKEHGEETRSSLSSNPNFLSIDIANTESRIGIEVDGPSHFVHVLDSYENNNFPNPTNNYPSDKDTHDSDSESTKSILFDWNGEQYKVNGPTMLKHRLLSKLGWRMIHLPFYEWHALGDDESKGKYCNKLLNTVNDND